MTEDMAQNIISIEDQKNLQGGLKLTDIEDNKRNVSENEISVGQKLIEYLKSTNTTIILPQINFEENRILFPILKEIGEDPSNVSVLDKLAAPAVNILQKETYEVLPVCPEHPENLLTTTRICCSECNSINVKKLYLVEHKVCGFIADTEIFGQKNVTDIATCPKCEKNITNPKRELRSLGFWFLCSDCGEKFDNISNKLFCRKFNHDFDINSAEYLSVPYYSVNNSSSADVDTITLLTKLSKAIETFGFSTQKFVKVIGRSGVPHSVSIHGKKEDKQVSVFFRSSDKQLPDVDVNSIIAECADLPESFNILICIPSISSEAKAMARYTGTSIITGKEYDEVFSQLEKLVAEHINK
ncbi:hypothetical protein C6989_05465 [Nitrosopumilus sp. b2]|nr:hypothetical protein C6989_05465 [Nitrosopumilus sp. b2]